MPIAGVSPHAAVTRQSALGFNDWTPLGFFLFNFHRPCIVPVGTDVLVHVNVHVSMCRPPVRVALRLRGRRTARYVQTAGGALLEKRERDRAIDLLLFQNWANYLFMNCFPHTSRVCCSMIVYIRRASHGVDGVLGGAWGARANTAAIEYGLS